MFFKKSRRGQFGKKELTTKMVLLSGLIKN